MATRLDVKKVPQLWDQRMNLWLKQVESSLCFLREIKSQIQQWENLSKIKTMKRLWTLPTAKLIARKFSDVVETKRMMMGLKLLSRWRIKTMQSSCRLTWLLINGWKLKLLQKKKRYERTVKTQIWQTIKKHLSPNLFIFWCFKAF